MHIQQLHREQKVQLHVICVVLNDTSQINVRILVSGGNAASLTQYIDHISVTIIILTYT